MAVQENLGGERGLIACTHKVSTALALLGGFSSLGRVPHTPFQVEVAGGDGPGWVTRIRDRHSLCRTQRVVPTPPLILSMPFPLSGVFADFSCRAKCGGLLVTPPRPCHKVEAPLRAS